MPRPDSLYDHGFARVAAAVPDLALADPEQNAERTIEMACTAAASDPALVVFPELGLVGYSVQDLLHQQALLTSSIDALSEVVDQTRDLAPILVVGGPLLVDHRLFNVAFVIHRGAVLGVVPKSYLPNYREFYEKRHFVSGSAVGITDVELLGATVPFGTDLLFDATDLSGFALAIEICEDLWAPIPPSTYTAMAGATVIANPSGSNITIGKADYRRQLCSSQSARTLSSYVYSAAGDGESTTDLAWDGHALIAENGAILRESERFTSGGSLIFADVDLDRLIADRLRTTSFGDCADQHRDHTAVRTVQVEVGLPDRAVPLDRDIPRFPFVPADASARDERCAEVYSIQVSGLTTRMKSADIDKLVIGVSGGLDSTQALLVAVRAVDQLGLPRENVLGYTMPGFGTSERTLTNARRLMDALGISSSEIDIKDASQQMLRDLGHPAADGIAAYDVTYENVQAGARTSLLFRLANHHHAMVVGTGDLSELALGWCTYGVGDHMSHYGVNASVPKTLIQYLVRWVADNELESSEARAVLEDILGTDISPELIPADDEANASGGPAQRSEDAVGPYELQDFNLYHVLRFGYPPSKVAFLAHHAWGSRTRGSWPATIPDEQRNEYDLTTICDWLREFLVRYFATSQFKRSALPDGPKVGSGGSLSPRGDWQAPSDASAAPWLADLDLFVAAAAGQQSGEPAVPVSGGRSSAPSGTRCSSH